MREETKPYHSETLGRHNNNIYENLIHQHSISSGIKEIIFEDMQPVIGVFATKTKGNVERKYFIEEKHIEHLPIKVKEKEELMLKKSANTSDIIIHPTTISSFRIEPEKTWKNQEFIDQLIPFTHSKPDHYTLLKILAVASYCSKTFLCLSTVSEFGKSSAFDFIHSITDKSPVFKPRSIPGVLHQINEKGNMVFDEVQGCKKEVKDIIEEFCQFVGGGKNYYINGAKKARGMKEKYDCTNQSITFLFNNIEQYKNPDSEFFDFLFANNPAMDSRFLKIKLDGVLTERFDKNFDVIKAAEDNKMMYIKIAKQLEWLRAVVMQNKYKRRWIRTNALLSLKGRKKLIYDTLTLFIDIYSPTQKTYDLFAGLLEQGIIDYKLMVSPLMPSITEEKI